MSDITDYNNNDDNNYRINNNNNDNNTHALPNATWENC